MSDIYATLQVLPKKKKRCPPESHDNNIVTPKKLRTAPPTPPPTSSRHSVKTLLPTNLSRLYTIHTALLHAVSHALATCAVSPTSDKGIVHNVVNHLSLTTYTGLTTQFNVDDLSRLCWIWEWDGKSLPTSQGKCDPADDDENPFLDSSASSFSSVTEWTRGSMGLVLSPTTHYSKTDRKRVPAYGIGIEVEMDIDKDMGGGMAAVARWTAATENRRSDFRAKLTRWIELHSSVSPIPHIPLADLPRLVMPSKISSFTRTLASTSPKASMPSLSLPSPASRSPSKSPTKKMLHDFAVPFPVLPAASRPPSALFPETPRHNRTDRSALVTPRTPASSSKHDVFDPSTPVHQIGSNASTAPETPTTSRRQALYDRVRQRSLTASPTKALSNEVTGGKLTRDQMLKLGQEEMRRRCLLGRLGGVAESVWMLFSTPTPGSSTTPTARKRRALPTSEVATAIIKSSPVPISSAEANESLSILAKLCPFFIKELTIAGKAWVEMPSSNTAVQVDASQNKKKPVAPSSPSAIKGKHESSEELVTRSPRKVKREAGGLREVREIIRRELELQD
ncbi:hypothetical protein L208DRAFT_1461995 [Tricholoma matsutake]|nr:hypothetical protein L208DRAFT_1461995 [Tricholoma matsutake 945]